MQIQKIAGILICLLTTFMFYFPFSAGAEDIQTAPGPGANTFTMENNLRKHVDLRAMFSYSPSKFDIYGEEHKLPNYGFRFEITRGFEIPTVPNLKVGIGVSYLHVGWDHSFTADIDSDPGESQVDLRKWEMNVNITGTMVLARYGYNFSIAKVPVAIENGIGIGYFYQRNDWKFKQTDGTTDDKGDLERTESAKAVFELGIKVEILKREHTNLSLNVNRLSMPVLIDIADGGTSYGPYKTEYVDELGVIWQVLF